MVDELAQNHLSQQDLDEADPARIFGQAVESDALSRKREAVQLGELELQLVEQAGALKRRRIESIQYCFEAMECVGQPEHLQHFLKGKNAFCWPLEFSNVQVFQNAEDVSSWSILWNPILCTV